MGGTREQEAAHLGPREVEDQRPPVAMLAATGIGVLVEMGAVEEREPVGVLGEVRGNPVENDSKPRLVRGVHKMAEVVGRPVA